MANYTPKLKNGDDLFRIGSQLYRIGETGITKTSIKKSWDRNKITDYEELDKSEVEDLFKDIIDSASDRYDISAYGGYKNETGYGPSLLKSNDEAADYLGREPLGTAPTRAEELKMRPELIINDTTTPERTAYLKSLNDPDSPNYRDPNNISPSQVSNPTQGAGFPTQSQTFSLSGNNLRVGSSGENVKDLQTYLKGIGLYQGKVDGIFGPKTDQAVRQFQSSRGLTSDGIVGPKTASAIQAVQGGSNPPGNTLATYKAPDDPTNQFNTATGQPNPNYSPEAVDSASSINYKGQTYSTANPEEASFIKNVVIPFLDQMDQQGLTINPNLDLGSDEIAKIFEKAKESVHPQYAQQISGVIDDFKRNAGLAKEEYDREITDKEDTFQRTLGNARENFAEQGTIFSGQRTRDELGLKNLQDRSLAAFTSQYGNKIGGYAREAEKSLGTSGFSGYQLPTINRYSSSLSGRGGFNLEGLGNTGYTPGTYQLGSIPLAEEAAARALRNQNIDQASKRKASGLSYADLYN